MTPLAFAAIAMVHLLAAISPGPSFVLAVRTAAGEGLRPALALAAGFGLGAALWALAAITGLAILFDLVPLAFTILKVLGGLFLVWLAISMWRDAPNPMPRAAPGTPPRSALAAFRLGLVSFLANPKPAVFFGAVFVGLVPGDAPLWSLALVVANVALVETIWYAAVARAFSLPRARAAYARFKTAMDRMLGVGLGLLGIRIALP
ncbi:LysE family translocator [Jannaschia aquimarina]|uniref:RhtC_3 protein n=1 Tax=Jannaschia aquimarina TaxID=935700 RepID=A0A0D1EJ03_9RHOB|nr:LysE family transporter [Jannaschia aquimarina]KIT15780.1 Threonine efflux protein [Jannaschia aquimarina]SNT20955.1 Threonine/homoserine/homoserine lactone efflux protein [Jannaschia aquimarina]